MIILVLISVIIQLFGIPFIGFFQSSHDLEFNYIYNWNLVGTGGYYDGYSETFKAEGNYKIDFNGNIGNVSGTVSWTWTENDYGNVISSIDNYIFSYSLLNGSYIWGTDQDEIDTSGLNVWFHIPQGLSAQNRGILDANYTLSGPSTFWAGKLVPFLSVKLYSIGTFERDDEYGQFTANYISEYHFTPCGYLLGELWTETDRGFDKDTGRWSEFNINSYVCVTSANYIRPFDFLIYFLTYWSWIFIIGVLLFIVYEKYRWRTRYVSGELKASKDIVIERNLPKNAQLSISSKYVECIPAYLTNANLQDKLIISAYSQDKIFGIGFIEQKRRVGTFFGTYINEMVKFSKVKYAFCEYENVGKLKIIEEYNIFQINDIQNQEYNYDATLIRSGTDFYLPAIMKLIANEDYGRKRIKRTKWVKEAAKNDIIVVATAKRDDEWIKDILYEVHSRNYPKPEGHLDEILLGVGFATPGDITGWLYGLYVHPAFRNFGIGRNLMMARLSMLKEIGVNNVITEIADWNGPAKSIYKHINAEIIGKMKLFGRKMPKVKVRRY
ncbi:MAG: GNAT family N-acetyltransferase [Promethearchaeota archaeon]